MREYIKSKVWRTRDLNNEYREVLFGKESQLFVPGCQVKIYKSDRPPLFIASGRQEPWVRLIGNRDYFDIFDTCKDYIKFERTVTNPLPTLMVAENPSFVVSSEGIGAFFSYVSTYPKQKFKVCYLGDSRIQMDWITTYEDVVTNADELKDEEELYVIGRRDLFSDEIINSSKESYLI